MRYPIRLFLGNEEVEFSSPPEILFNYSETELRNPTIVKNSYTKAITVEGTAANNRLFGHIYNMERLQAYDGKVMGSCFNPLVKTDFTLYYNGSIYESGYFKLDEIRRNNNNIEYDITLYGGLGDYFYNLGFREDGNPMELSDLTYGYEKRSGDELGFTIYKETVAEAWANVGSGKWGTLNFAACYNGIPSNLSADKFLINSNGITDFIPSGSTVPERLNYSIGTSDKEHTEWETFDLRSYLQRPVVRVRDVIEAMCDGSNNGGYKVNLDETFFSADNPYYSSAWFTLPLLPELDIPATTSSALTVTAITHEKEHLYKIWDGGANATNVQIDVDVKFTPSGNYTGDTVYMSREYKGKGGTTLNSGYAKYCVNDSDIALQLVGYNSTGVMSEYSDLYILYTPRDYTKLRQLSMTTVKSKFEGASPAAQSVSGVKVVPGKFTLKDGEYVWTDMDGNTQTLRFSFPSNGEFTRLKMKIFAYGREYFEQTFVGETNSNFGENLVFFFDTLYQKSSTWQQTSVVRNLGKVAGTLSYTPVGATGTTTSFEGFYSGRHYSKKDLLTLGVTPAQFLLSYAKIFGLYFIKDAESKTIDILSRHSFYERDNVVNINDLIDKGSGIKITPVAAKSQYYDFGLEQAESEAGESYRKAYGNDYGTAVVNTGFQFEKEHSVLFEGNCFKGGINVMEKNKYFLKPTNGVPCLVDNGFSYWYYTSGDTTEEMDRTSKPMSGAVINPDGLRFYDAFPKPQFHKEDNSPSDGSMVLLFYDGKRYPPANGWGYHLTDDTEKMYVMNDQTPCWIMTRYTTDRYGDTIALEVGGIPNFTRDLYNDFGYISHSFDLGTPLTTYVPNKYVSDWQSIYSKAWKSFITDLYDVNTRVLNCRCLLNERPNTEWMRRFYWFDNSYWRLNTIKDWNISSFDTTEMEFIKVQDMANYDNVRFSTQPTVEWKLDSYTIGADGGTISGFIYVSDGSLVYTDDDNYPITMIYDGYSEDLVPSEDYMSPTYARGGVNIPVTLTIPRNDTGEEREIRYCVLDSSYPEPGSNHFVSIIQEA